MSIWIWVGFIIFILVMLTLDLGVLNRKAHVVRTSEALTFTGITVILSLIFSVLVWYLYREKAIADSSVLEIIRNTDNIIVKQTPSDYAFQASTEYLTGWILEYSLSLDNIFVIALIFSYFRVPAVHQHRVLFWGILGALIMRGAMIAVGATLVHHFHWILYVFGALLIYTAIKLLFASEEGVHPDKNFAVRLARRIYPVAPHFEGEKFFTRIKADAGPLCPSCHSDMGEVAKEAQAGCPRCGAEVRPEQLAESNPPAAPPPAHLIGRRAITPLFLVLLVVETTDVFFAIDSIPAIFGITTDPFIVFTSNVFAILGLRSLYFALAAVVRNFRYMKTALVFVLAFIGVKMLIVDLYDIPTTASLLVIVGILGIGAIASLFATQRERAMRRSPVNDLGEAATLAYRNARRLVILVMGITIIASSIPIGLLPGPGGIAVFIGGLALLATEFVWARALLKGIKAKTQAIAQRADALISKKPRPWLIPPVMIGFAALLWAVLHFIPKHHSTIIFGSIGPALAILFWSYLTLKRWREHKQRKSADQPVESSSIIAEPKPDNDSLGASVATDYSSGKDKK